MSKRKLTPKQRKFVDEYIKLGNATQAAINAGYSKRTAKSIGQENLTKPDLKSFIDQRMAEIESHRIMDAQEALQLLTRIARGEEKETVVVSTQFDVDTIEKEADLKTRIAAAKEILKRYPDSDDLLKAQVRRAVADAEIAETKAKEIQKVNQHDDSTIVVDDLEDTDNDGED
ncbi:terminase small subunit [Lentilactobacillus kefiri]|uniref:terminase small subunit n=1 Tax=Lentilactobacillus kefiri TaxID=33962 RepID=UPI002070CCBC|nr:terminase small subunit [Lentilactobacillus kefiri]MCP9369158.1 terminase small subunit [Lentilactobacillus kefiri]DAJ07136.1 MAG TPA: Terminase small subunit [Caudoviricetes sp.]